MTWPSQAIISSGQAVIASALLMVAIAIKYLVEQSRAQLTHNGPGSYSYQARVANRRVRPMLFRIYQLTFHLRLLLAILLPVIPTATGIVLVISFVAEMHVLFRYHLVLMTAMSGLFVTLGPIVHLGWWDLVRHGLNFSDRYTAPGVPFVQLLIVAMYSLSALRKWRNGFTNGKVLSHGLVISISQRRYPDHILGSDRLLRLGDLLCSWPVVAKLVVVVEVTIGFLLMLPLPLANLAGALLGATTQLSFTILFPRTLLPFTITVMAALVLWA